MPTNQEQITSYETLLNNLAAQIQTKINLLAANHEDQLDANEVIETAKASIMLDVLQARYDVEGHPQYNNLIYTNAEQRKAAQSVAQNEDASFQLVVTDSKTLYAQGKSLEADIEFLRKQFNAAELAMTFYSTNP